MGVLGVYHDAVFELIVILATKWDSCHPYVHKSTTVNPSFYYSHRKPSFFTMTVNTDIYYLYVYYRSFIEIWVT